MERVESQAIVGVVVRGRECAEDRPLCEGGDSDQGEQDEVQVDRGGDHIVCREVVPKAGEGRVCCEGGGRGAAYGGGRRWW